MISVTFDSKLFQKKMNNFVAYANGFIEGAVLAKPQMLDNMGSQVADIISQYIDSIASANPQALHHVYEWGQTGSESARLFDVDYVVTGGGLSINATFSQSTSIQAGSKTPFYNKAYIMENGLPVTISPKNSNVLAFEDNGETVFTKKTVVVSKPGGDAVVGSFETNFNNIINVYLSQAIFDVTDVGLSIKDSSIFKRNLRRGVSGGRSVGLATGKKWITGGKA